MAGKCYLKAFITQLNCLSIEFSLSTHFKFKQDEEKFKFKNQIFL